MKKTAIALTGLLALAVSAPLQADDSLKVGIVSMQEVISGFYKTKQAQAEINERTDEIKSELDVRQAKLRDYARELEDLTKIIQDESVRPEFRQIKIEERSIKQNEAMALERDIMQMRRQRERQVQLEVERIFRGIREEVSSAVDEIARRDGYDLVFDSSGVGMGGMPLLLFSKDAVNFTATVLSELNREAPEEFLDADPVDVPAGGVDVIEGVLEGADD